MKKIVSILLTACMLSVFSLSMTVTAATKYAYNPSKALDYAAKHWNDGVGLCAEFVWQCAKAGGIKIDKKTGTRSCFNGIINNSHATKHQLKLNSKGMATKADNSAILAPGDVVVQYCTGCDLFPHIILFSKYDSNGNALYYAHNGAMNNAKYQLNQNSQHKKKSCNIIAYVAHFPQNNTGTSNNPSAPASISLSKSSLNLDLSSKPSDTVNVTLSGTLPSKYYLYFNCDSPTENTWGSWSDNDTKNSITITATEETKNGSVATITLQDEAGKVYATKKLTINVTKPQEPVGIVLSKSILNLDLSTKPSDTIDITLTGALPSQYKISRSCTSEIITSWSSWQDNDTRTSVTVTATENTQDGSTCFLLLMDESGNVCANAKFTINISKSETRDISLSKSTLNLDYENNPSETITITSVGSSSDPYDLRIELAPEFDFMWSNPTDNTIDLTITAIKNIDRTAEAIIYLQDKNGNIIKTKILQVNLVASGVEIIYDGNGGKNAPASENVDVGSTLYITSEEPTRTGYTFKGWSKSKSDKYPQFKAGDAIHVSDQGFTLYAIWAKDSDSSADNFADRNKNEISVYVGGKKVNFDVQPRLINNRTMVPLRAIFEALGATVDWDEHTRTVRSTKDDITVSLTVNYPRIDVNGEDIMLDSPPRIINGRTLVPVRAISESFDCEVVWHGDIKVVEIIK